MCLSYGDKNVSPAVWQWGIKEVTPRSAVVSNGQGEDTFFKDNNRCTKCAWILSENGTHQCILAQREMRLKGMRMDPRGPSAKPEPKNASTSA
jgi:hypothetical protein